VCVACVVWVRTQNSKHTRSGYKKYKLARIRCANKKTTPVVYA
jgi:hypothetical protein